MKRYVLVEYDPDSANDGGLGEDGEPFDMLAFLCNEFNAHKIWARLIDEPTASPLTTTTPVGRKV